MTTNAQYVKQFKANAHDFEDVVEEFANDKGIEISAARAIAEDILLHKDVKLRITDERRFGGVRNGEAIYHDIKRISVSYTGYAWGEHYRARASYMFCNGECYAVYR